MTVTVEGPSLDSTGKADSRDWQVFSPVNREGPGGGVITKKPQPVRVVAGVFKAELEPGLVVLVNPDGKRYTVMVPDEDASLWELIAAAEAFPPDTAQEALASAVTTFLEENPVITMPVEGISDSGVKGREVVQAETAADVRTAAGASTSGATVFTGTPEEARSAIGAGTSDLTLGTTSGTAKAGDYQPAWTDVTGDPTDIPALLTAFENIVGNYEPETLALFDRMVVRPDFDHRDAINTLIAALKSGGVWAKLDGLHVLAAHSEQAALLNWKADARNLTAYNSPTFTADQGFTGDGSTSYLRTTASFAGSGLMMDDGDESLGVWVRTNVAHANAISVSLSTNDSGTSTVRYLNPRNTGTNISWKMNFATTQASPAHASGDNMFIGMSRDATDANLYLNGALDDTHTQAISDDPRALTMWLLIGRTGSTYSARQHSAAFYGRRLTAAEHTVFYNALADYMTAVGAV